MIGIGSRLHTTSKRDKPEVRRAQNDDVHRLIVVRPDQRVRNSGSQLVTDGAELLGSVHRHDADITVRVVKHKIITRKSSPSGVIGRTIASKFSNGFEIFSAHRREANATSLGLQTQQPGGGSTQNCDTVIVT